MGRDPWFHYVPFQADIAKAFQELREAEFKAGRYTCIARQKPRTIEELLKLAAEDGSNSVLDFTAVTTTPRPKLMSIDDQDALEGDAFERHLDESDATFCKVTPLSTADLRMLYGTDKPSRAQVERKFELFDYLGRGQGVYLVLYSNGKPTEIYFAGNTVD